MPDRALLYLATDDGVNPPELSGTDWAVHRAATPEAAREMLRFNGYHVGVLPVTFVLPGTEWRDLLLAANHTRWIALVQSGALEQAPCRQLVHDFCHDFHTLPCDPYRLEVSLGHAWGMQALCGPDEAVVEESQMVGSSAAMRKLFQRIRRVASVDAPVLLQGESGTGKEMTARAVHERSLRGNGPFVAINCGALPSGLIQTELFGHERGAFTGALKRRQGRIEAAHGGTLLLDEIADLPLDQQVNLLRFLEEGTIDPVGGDRSIAVDVRVIAATNLDLEERVRRGLFREDLYYRLNVLRLDLPPLRERQEDIELLARYFFSTFVAEGHGRARGFSQQAFEMMRRHDWPGNVRELINRVRRAVVMCDRALITPADLGLERRSQEHRPLRTLEEARAHAEQAAIRAMLRRCGGNHSQASRELGVSRVTLYRLMHKYGIEECY
ncbi:sigma-54 dependent transcriptional regulator [Aquisalimonas lutea]|uniref:sigma-54 dependent transcriptional regulator n=1 Tax=Aquisalimonas lutea TaxID=1327750 RepID=UPI0025B34EA0|nr:sigma-54 dependent transcriptional regulator [Aquisalimonas lutea]MDN3516975.1 sigma-54 dependent transcriptional regulator [Aquisalimonas lutea]